MDNKTIRRTNLATLSVRYRTLEQLSAKTGITASYLSQIRGGYRQMGDAAARKIERAFRKPVGWMDQTHETSEPSNAGNISPVTQKRGVPVISFIRAGELADIQCNLEPGEGEHLESPDYKLGPRGWAHVVEGPSMDDGTEKGIPSGWIIFADPDLTPFPNAYVIAKHTGDQRATFKQLITEDGRWYLKPLNKDPIFKTIEIDDPALRVIAVVTEARPPSRKLA